MADNLEPGLAWTEIPTLELGSERMHAGSAGVAGVTCAFSAAEEAPFLGRGIAILRQIACSVAPPPPSFKP